MKIQVSGSIDRLGYKVPNGITAWTVEKSAPIVGGRMMAVLAKGTHVTGKTFWIAGPMDIVGRPGHGKPPMLAEESMLWLLQQYAEENHNNRVNGDVR